MSNEVRVWPEDEFNRELVSHVHPADWENPEPAGTYNMLVIGAGPAGLVAAAGAAGLGAKVALVEKHLMGGDCLNVGCVPSKCIIRSSRTAEELRRSAMYRVDDGHTAPAFERVMERMRRIRAGIAEHDSVKRFSDLGMDVFLGAGRFTGADRFEIDGRTIRFKRAVIATGARAAAPSVPGIEDAGYLTNETVFSLEKLPSRLAVIGAGPIGCELAQAFARLGSRVTLVVRSRLLSREDPAVSELLTEAFKDDAVDMRFGASLKEVASGPGGKMLVLESDGKEERVEVDELLVAVGRAPNVEDLGLDDAGVGYDEKHGVHVDERLQTSNPRIYAAGDVCMKEKFTHAADAAARIVIQNSLFMGRKKLGSLVIPWCTYTDPEVAHVGQVATGVPDEDSRTDVYTVELSETDRALCDGETRGFVKIHTAVGGDRIVGATIVASHAGEMIGEVCVAMAAKMGLGKLASVIHPYPTQAEAIRRAGDLYNRSRLTPAVKKLFEKFLAWRRR